jgi:tetratricopeptide (TPR) repeat protein
MMPGRAAALLLALLLALGLACSCVPPAAAQSGGTANLLSAPGSWPTTGSADATTAFARDPLALYMNPAGLALQDERSLLVHHGLLAFETSWDLAAVSYPVPGLGAVGAGVARVGTGGIDAYDASNRPLGSIGYSETSLAAGISRHLRWGVWGGLTFKVLSQSLGDASAAAPGLDLGLLLRPSLLRGGQVGLSIQNVVAGSLDLGGESAPLDRSFRLGLASPPLRVGRAGSARLALDLSTQGAEGLKPRLSAELAPTRHGSVRAGLADGDPTFGVGLRWRRYGFDYALVNGPVETTQQFALRIAWGEPASRYAERRRAEYRRDAEDSLRAELERRIALERSRAEAAEREGDLEGALIHWEVLQRQKPGEREYGARADSARTAIRAQAERAVADEGARLLETSLLAMCREALARGDVEEASALLRGLESGAAAHGGPLPDRVADVRALVEAARGTAVASAVARADSLRRAGRTLEAVDAAGYALRLKPGDPAATEIWTALGTALAKDAAEARTFTRRMDALSAVAEASRAYSEGRYADAAKAVDRALALDPANAEAKAWQARLARRLSTPKPELDARIRTLYIDGMEAFTAGNYREALRSWEQILVLDPLNESARRNVLEARERLKTEARR